MKTLGQIAFETLFEAMNWTPDWPCVSDKTRDAWELASAAVVIEADKRRKAAVITSDSGTLVALDAAGEDTHSIHHAIVTCRRCGEQFEASDDDRYVCGKCEYEDTRNDRLGV